MRLLRMATAQAPVSTIELTLIVPLSVDPGGVYKATFNNGLVNVTLEVVGPGTMTGEIPVGTGTISVDARKTSSPALNAGTIEITATSPSYSQSDGFSTSETIELTTPGGEIDGCDSSTAITVSITEG